MLIAQMGESPLPGGVGGVGGVGVGVGAPHLVVPPHHQPLRLSPLPHQGTCYIIELRYSILAYLKLVK